MDNQQLLNEIKNTSLMLYRLTCLIGLLLINISSFGQSKKSDSFFEKGVELYNNGCYQEAIPFFEKVVKLDHKEIPSESIRYDYGDVWLASCYYKLDYQAKAREISPSLYFSEPVDRRLTIEADREADLSYQLQQQGNLEEAIKHAKSCLAIEKSVLGETSLYCVQTYLAIGNLYRRKGELNNAIYNYNKGLSLLAEMKIENSIYNFNLLNGKVDVYLSSNDSHSAFIEAKAMKNISDYFKSENIDLFPSAIVDLTYAKICINDNDKDKALDYALSAFDCFLAQYESLDEEEFLYLSEYCFDMLRLLQQYNAAIPLLQKAITKTKDNRGHKGILLSYLAECDEDINTFQESLQCLSGTVYVDVYNQTKILMAQNVSGNDKQQAINLYYCCPIKIANGKNV